MFHGNRNVSRVSKTVLPTKMCKTVEYGVPVLLNEKNEFNKSNLTKN